MGKLKLTLLLFLNIFFISSAFAQDYTIKTVEEPVNGKIEIQTDGKFVYQPNQGFIGADSLLYEICQGDDCKTIKADFNVKNTSIDDQVNAGFKPVTDFLNTIIFFNIYESDEKVFLPKKDAFKVEIEKGAFSGDLASNDFQSTSIPFVLIWLIGGAIFFTILMKFINFSGFKHAIEVVRGNYDDPNDSGEVSHFQALTAALSGTVGVGNIAGVALAVSMGGPGATFWMIMAGIFGMSSKFVECTLGVKYRNVNEDGSVSGGPMYYLSKGLAKQGKAGLGKFLAVFFAIACIGGSLGGGNMVQINQATEQFINATGAEESFLYGNGYIFGIVMAVVVALIIIGGIKSIAKVTDKVVPFMVGIYVTAALVVIFYNFSEIPAAFGAIINGAFTAEGIYGGFIGVLIVGIQRAAFSNEAGIGSASIAHSAAKTDEPISEGIVALLEPFIDTVVVCTMTALVIIITDSNEPGQTEGIALTSRAFASTISWFPTLLSVAVILFALSTMISWSYYGLKAWTYLFGESKAMDVTYKALFCIFVVVGSAISRGSVFDFGDAMIFAMCFPNVLGLYFLAPEIRHDLIDYFKRIKSGEIKRFK